MNYISTEPLPWGMFEEPYGLSILIKKADHALHCENYRIAGQLGMQNQRELLAHEHRLACKSYNKAFDPM